MPDAAEDPVLRSARREAIVVFAAWLVAMVYTLTYCSIYGYGRSIEDLKFVNLGWGVAFPDWVFWGIVVPWAACFVLSYWFSYLFMKDEDLGEELEEGSDASPLEGGKP